MRRAIAVILATGLLPLLMPCEDERLVALEAEIAQLDKARVPREAVEEAKQERARVVAQGEATREVLHAAEAREQALAAELAERIEAVEREAARMPDSVAALAALQSEEAALRERTAAQRRALAARFDAARGLCERVVEVEGQLRDTDPDWAAERRREVVEELVRAGAERHPADPVLGELAATLDAPDARRSGTAQEQTRWARDLAERLRARLVAVYAERRGDAARSAKQVEGSPTGTAVSALRSRCPIVAPQLETPPDVGAPPSTSPGGGTAGSGA